MNLELFILFFTKELIYLEVSLLFDPQLSSKKLQLDVSEPLNIC